MIRISVLERSPIFVRGLTVVLGGAGFDVTDVTGAPWSGRHVTDVFLVNPDTLAGTCVTDFVAEVCATPVVVTVPDAGHEHDVQNYLKAGVTGVLDRHAEPGVVIEGLRSAAAGRSFVGVAGPYGDDQTSDNAGETPSRSPDRAALSPRESQVLVQIARGRTHGQTARLLGISQHTVDTYVKRIRSKLALGNKADLTRAAVLHDLGWVS
jgi:DNA-binding NarL/FixJ family response regulator